MSWIKGKTWSGALSASKNAGFVSGTDFYTAGLIEKVGYCDTENKRQIRKKSCLMHGIAR